MNKTLIAYFSLEHSQPQGITHGAALAVQKLTGGELFRIEPETPYPDTFQEVNREAALKKRDNIRPKLKRCLENLDGFDKVFLLYPNYWGTMPMEVFAFVESLDFSGKKIYPICTHEGSGLGYSVVDLGKTIKGGEIGPALAISKQEFDNDSRLFDEYLDETTKD